MYWPKVKRTISYFSSSKFASLETEASLRPVIEWKHFAAKVSSLVVKVSCRHPQRRLLLRYSTHQRSLLP